jgi:Tfp pilus assembly protein PilF
VYQRVRSAEERGAVLVQETVIEKPKKNPRVSAIEMQQVRSLVRSAEKLLVQNKHKEAECAFIQALTIQPDAHDVQAQLAKLYLTTGREPKSEVLYAELVRHVQDVSFYANLGLAYYRQGKFVQSCHSYQEALNRDPNTPERSASLGRACIAAHRYKEAVPLLEKACARLSRDTHLLHLLAECYLQIGDTENAEDAYRRINKIEPYNEVVKERLNALART